MATEEPPSMIHDVMVRDLQINADERGELTEIWRADWAFYEGGGHSRDGVRV